MEWNDIFPKNHEPSMAEISDFIGEEAKELWESLITYMSKSYGIKPKLFYSGCSGKPGWNIKFQKSGQSFGTFYPEQNAFSVLLVISYKLDAKMAAILPSLSPGIAELYQNSGDYMKLGKWLMFQIKDKKGLEDYKKIASVKLAPKDISERSAS